MSNGTKATKAEQVADSKNAKEIVALEEKMQKEEEIIASHYQNIGRIYYEEHKNYYEPPYKEDMEQIGAAMERMDEHTQAIAGLKGFVICKGCQAQQPKGSLFCSQCGNKFPVEVDQELAMQGAICTNCGSLIEGDGAFCSKCGFKIQRMTVPSRVESAPIPPVVEEAPPAVLDTSFLAGVDTDQTIVHFPGKNQQPGVEALPVTEPVDMSPPLPVMADPVPPFNFPVPESPTEPPEAFSFSVPEVSEEPAVIKRPRVCTGCGCPVPEGMAFCTNCGNKVEEEPAPQVSAQLCCSHCGQPAGEYQFCIHCGNPIHRG